MNCPITLKGIQTDCAGTGGVKEIYIIDRIDVSTLVVDPSTSVITGITPVSGKKFYTYQLRKQIANMESTINADDQAGTVWVQTDLNASFQKMNAAKRLELQALSLGSVAVIVKDGNNKYWYLGYENPVTLTAGTGSTGTAYGDANQYAMTLTDMGSSLPYEVDPLIISAIIQ